MTATSIYKALADESRLRILRVLLTGRFSVNELVAILAMGQSRVSRHLKLLLEAGLVEVRREGTWAYYEAVVGADDALLGAQLSLLRHHAGQLPGTEEDEPGRLECLDSRRRRSRDFHDRIAPQWSRMRKELLGDGEVTSRLLAALEGAEVIADLGCGAGELLPELARGARRVIGVDSSPSMLDQARQRVHADASIEGSGAVELRLGALEHLPLADGEADAAVLNMVLHHLADPPSVLREVRRALAPDGRLVVCDLASHDQEWMREAYGDQWLGFGAGELRGFLGKAGLEIVEVTHYKDTPGGGVQIAVARTTGQGA